MSVTIQIAGFEPFMSGKLGTRQRKCCEFILFIFLKERVERDRYQTQLSQNLLGLDCTIIGANIAIC